MYLRDSCYVLARRWFVVVPVFLIAAVCVNIATIRTPYGYSARATVVLLSPSITNRADPTLANPYLSFSGNLQSTATILTAVATDDDAAAALARAGATAKYTVGPDPKAPGAPTLLIAAQDSHVARATRTRDAVIAFLGAELDRRQRAARSPAKLLITLSVVSSTPPRRLATAKVKMLAGGAAAAVVLPVLAAFGAEGWASRRARRAGAARTVPAGAEPGWSGVPEQGVRAHDLRGHGDTGPLVDAWWPAPEPPLTEQPVTEQPVTEQPLTEQPVVGGPVAGEDPTGPLDSPFGAVPVVGRPRRRAGGRHAEPPTVEVGRGRHAGRPPGR
jgi:hypothetical protein